MPLNLVSELYTHLPHQVSSFNHSIMIIRIWNAIICHEVCSSQKTGGCPILAFDVWAGGERQQSKDFSSQKKKILTEVKIIFYVCASKQGCEVNKGSPTPLVNQKNDRRVANDSDEDCHSSAQLKESKIKKVFWGW